MGLPLPVTVSLRATPSSLEVPEKALSVWHHTGSDNLNLSECRHGEAAQYQWHVPA